MARPVRPPFDTDFCKRLFARLAEVEAAARAAAAEETDAATAAKTTEVTVRIAGGYRIALDAERVIRRELIVNSLGSLVGLLLMVFVVFRTPWILVYGVAPLALAALLTLGLNGLRGPLSPATSGNSALLFGLGIDGVVLMYLRYMEERRRGFGEEEAIARTSGTAVSVMLAYGTTVATFFALILVDFPSLEDLGRLVGLGMLACCGLVLLLLPALIGVTSPRLRAHTISAAWLGRLVERRGRVDPGGRGGHHAGARRGRDAAASSNTSLEKLQARTEGAALEEEVADRFGLARDVFLAIGEGPDPRPAARLGPRSGGCRRAGAARGRRQRARHRAAAGGRTGRGAHAAGAGAARPVGRPRRPRAGGSGRRLPSRRVPSRLSNGCRACSTLPSD